METSNLRNCEHTCTGATIPLPPKSSSSSSTCELADHQHHQCFEELSSSEAKFEGLRRRHSDSMISSEEVPYWLKDLLDEPADTLLQPSLHRSHRRSSSDSIAYIQKTIEKAQQEEEEEEEESKHISTTSNYATNYIFPTSAQHLMNNPSPSSRNIISTTDSSKRGAGVKRHSAQQHRARKVQYIGELERSIQALQVEGYEVSAELEFLDQQNLILGMENRALKQRLDTLSQEQFIKCLEQEVLEREITRLRNLYQQQQQHKQKQQQQQQQQKHYGRNRSKRQDLDSSFAKLSLKNKGTESQKAR